MGGVRVMHGLRDGLGLSPDPYANVNLNHNCKPAYGRAIVCIPHESCMSHRPLSSDCPSSLSCILLTWMTNLTAIISKHFSDIDAPTDCEDDDRSGGDICCMPTAVSRLLHRG